MLLTAQQLLNFQRCHRQAFLDAYGDRQVKAPPSDFLQQLRADRYQHQQDFLATLSWHQPQYPSKDQKAGTVATRELMHQGASHIHGGILQVEVQPHLTLASPFDLLTKVVGQSCWGDWAYEPTSIQLSKRPKLEYQIMVTFQAMILAAVQGQWPESAYLYLRERGWYTVDLERNRPKLDTLLQDLITLLQEQHEPEVFIVNNRCSLCGWFEQCYSLAQDQQHLSLLPGVTPSRYPILVAHELTTVEALAAVNPQQLHMLTGFSHDVTEKLVYQAQSVTLNQPILLSPWPSDTPEVLPIAPVELYFDIEAEPSLNLAYLHGVLVVDREQDCQIFYPLLAKSPAEEAQVWQDFLTLVQKYPTAPIFHFCAYEAQTVERLAALYHTPASQVEALLDRFLDLHWWVTKTVTLPIESYTLKLIARWVGFQWRNADANGAQSIYWYNQWIETGEAQFLDAILHYNEDDCRATWQVKDWLSDYLSRETHASKVSGGKTQPRTWH